MKASGVHDTSFHNTTKCDVDIRVNSYVLVMLPGGTTMCQEIGERMTKKPTELPPPTTKFSTRETVLSADWRVYLFFF